MKTLLRLCALVIRFAARNDGSGEFTGQMAVAEIFSGVLTSSQVSAFYAAGPPLIH